MRNLSLNSTRAKRPRASRDRYSSTNRVKISLEQDTCSNGKKVRWYPCIRLLRRRPALSFPSQTGLSVSRASLSGKRSIVGIILEAIITGILTGGVYALMASGLTLVFGVMDIINVGQGALVILGAYLSFFLEQKLHIDLFVGLLITMPVMFGLGLLIEWLFIRPIKRDRTMLSILVTFGVALIIEGFLNIIFSADYVKLQAWYITASFP